MKKLLLLLIGLFMFSVSQVYADRGGSPPGLSGKGGAEFPRGLENMEKTPSGWSKGNKEGWERIHHHHYHRHHHTVVNNIDNN